MWRKVCLTQVYIWKKEDFADSLKLSQGSTLPHLTKDSWMKLWELLPWGTGKETSGTEIRKNEYIGSLFPFSLCSLVYTQRLMGNKICWRSVDFEPWIWCFQSLPTRAKMGSENRALDREDFCHFSCVPFLCIFGTCTLILNLYSGN